MEVILNDVTGFADAVIAMHMSKRSYTKELDKEIRKTIPVLISTGVDIGKGTAWLNALKKWGTKHITLLKFIDISATVIGLHRAGQDDWDSHAKRFDNRIIRSSTRLATFDYEMSDFYKDKIIPTDEALSIINMNVPDTIEVNGQKYVKTINGYIDEKYKDDKDVKRGLYMLSIPSNFIFRINLAEFAHVYKERNANSGANPEVKKLCETLTDLLIERTNGFVTRELLNDIKN